MTFKSQGRSVTLRPLFRTLDLDLKTETYRMGETFKIVQGGTSRIQKSRHFTLTIMGGVTSQRS